MIRQECPVVRFNREACKALVERSNYPHFKAFADAIGMSPGHFHDVVVTGRRDPSTDLIRRFAIELRVPITALICPEPCDLEPAS